MDTNTLATLEQAIEPYRRAGFVITSQSERAITMTGPPERFSYTVFLLALIFFWPVAIIYLILFNSRKGKKVCVRITSQGHIEESGFTLQVAERDRRRKRLLNLAMISIPIFLILSLLGLLILRSIVSTR